MIIADILKDIEFKSQKPEISVLVDTDFTKEIRIVMKKGAFMKEHKTKFPIVVHVIKGSINFGVSSKLLELNQGKLIALKGDTPHDLVATENSIIRLTLYKEDSKKRVENIVAD